MVIFMLNILEEVHEAPLKDREMSRIIQLGFINLWLQSSGVFVKVCK